MQVVSTVHIRFTCYFVQRASPWGGPGGQVTPVPDWVKFLSFYGVCEAIGGWNLLKFSRLATNF